MTGQPASQSGFNARADRAAQALRKNLKQRFPEADIPESRTVEVDANGRPPAPLPPEGSYARQAIEQQRRQAVQRPDPQAALEGDDDIQMQRQDPQATLTSDQGIQPAEAQTQSSEQQQLSPNAQRRISQLTEDLRRKDQELQQLLADGKKNKESMSELEQKMNALLQQHQSLLQTNLDNMDPDTRTQILMDGRLQEAIAQSEQRVLQQLLPRFEKLDRQSADAEMRRLSTIYPGFSVDVHGPLIEQFRRGNPRCTVEQAFRAVAEPEELQLAPQVRASAVPPVVQPGNGRLARQHNVQQSNPEQELIEESQQLKKLMRSTDPDDKRIRDRFVHEHLAKRLGHKLPS